jgi:hypothetical protein
VRGVEGTYVGVFDHSAFETLRTLRADEAAALLEDSAVDSLPWLRSHNIPQDAFMQWQEQWQLMRDNGVSYRPDQSFESVVSEWVAMQQESYKAAADNARHAVPNIESAAPVSRAAVPEVVTQLTASELFEAKRAFVEKNIGVDTTWWLGSRGRIEPVYEALKDLPVRTDDELVWDIEKLSTLDLTNPNVRSQIASTAGLQNTVANFATLEKWVSLYEKMTTSVQAGGYGIAPQPNDTFETIFNRFITLQTQSSNR